LVSSITITIAITAVIAILTAVAMIEAWVIGGNFTPNPAFHNPGFRGGSTGIGRGGNLGGGFSGGHGGSGRR